MIGRPTEKEAAPYYFTYIDQVPGDDPVAYLNNQTPLALACLSAISEADSLHRYEPDKWSIRQVLNHINDAERLFAARLFWFARGLSEPLPSFDQMICAAHIHSDLIPWAEHIEEFRSIRAASLTLVRHLPPEAWDRRGIASGNPFTVRALAWIMGGHVAHHMRLIG